MSCNDMFLYAEVFINAFHSPMSARRLSSDIAERRKRHEPASFFFFVGVGGASSRITWALAPPSPKAETPDRRGAPRFARFQSIDLEATSREASDKSMTGFKVRKWRLGGIRRRFIIIRLLMTPATPAPASRCPMFVLQEPM